MLVMVHGPLLSREDPAMGASVSLERQFSLERKLSEYAGYAMLAASVMILGYGLFRAFA
jgi:hypothetical protein